MDKTTMNGQWIGSATGGDGTGKLIVNIDKCDAHYEGVAFIHDDDPSMPISVALIQTKDLSLPGRFSQAWTGHARSSLNATLNSNGPT